jgi:hypothetical protein
MGVSGVHPNPDPVNWPGSYGQDVHTPAQENSILRQDYTTLEQEESIKDRYERLVNRTMLYHCKQGYCLKKNREEELVCHFDFPKALVGFKEIYEVPMDGARPYLIRPGRVAGSVTLGAEYKEAEKLIFQRNHPTLVHHIAELLTIWAANIEGRPVESFEQVIRYLLKYMMKDEPNSQSFSTICKAVVESAEDDEPVRKTFQKILMMTVGQHNFSKQECFHTVNGLDFVKMKRKIVPTATDTDKTDLTESSIATVYWKREVDDGYKAALDLHRRHPNVARDTARESLYNFARLYT